MIVPNSTGGRKGRKKKTSSAADRATVRPDAKDLPGETADLPDATATIAETATTGATIEAGQLLIFKRKFKLILRELINFEGTNRQHKKL